ncbi:glutathione S-transferase [Bradyrhizobium japonicum]
MITLYHCDAARSFRPLWMLEEMGLPYELKMLPFPPRVFAKEYLALNPLGTIPFMVDGETKMTESSGICHYLGIKHGPTPLMVGPKDPAYGAFLNWMYFSDATLTFPQTLVLRYTQLEPEERRNPQVAGDYAKWFLGRLRAVEAATANAETLAQAASPPLTLSSAMRSGSPTMSGSRRISGQMSQPIGRGCSSATDSSARLPRSRRPASSRMLRRA